MSNVNITLLQEQLRTRVLRVTFTKADGSKRVMRCTTKPSLLPEPIVENNDHLVTVWDLENAGFRRFRKDAVLEAEIVE